MTEEEIKLKGDMRHEIAIGVHTYRNCKCGRSRTRSGRCIVCLAEDLIELNAERHQKGDKK